MNSTTDSVPMIIIPIDTAYMVGQVFGYYVIPITALIGTLLRILLCYSLYKNRLPIVPKYILLAYKLFILIILNTILIGYQNIGCNACPESRYASYSFKIYQLYFSQYLVNVLRVQMNFFEVLITYERYCVLKRTASGLTRVNLRFIFLISLLIALALQLPDVFIREIKYSPAKNVYYFSFTAFGKTNFYFWYQVSILTIIRISTILSIIYLNIFNVIEYKNFIRNKLKMVKDTTKMHADHEFTRMIIIGTSLYAFGLINITWSFIISQINLSNKIYYTAFQNLAIMVSQEILMLVLLNDLFLYTLLDTNLIKSIKNTFFNKKKNQNASTPKN